MESICLRWQRCCWADMGGSQQTAPRWPQKHGRVSTDGTSLTTETWEGVNRRHLADHRNMGGSQQTAPRWPQKHGRVSTDGTSLPQKHGRESTDGTLLTTETWEGVNRRHLADHRNMGGCQQTAPRWPQKHGRESTDSTSLPQKHGRESTDSINILALEDIILTLPAHSVDAKRSFSEMKLIKTDWRSNLSNDNLTDLLHISFHMASIAEFYPTAAIHLWNNSRPRARRPEFVEFEDSEDTDSDMSEDEFSDVAELYDVDYRVVSWYLMSFPIWVRCGIGHSALGCMYVSWIIFYLDSVPFTLTGLVELHWPLVLWTSEETS